jgi:hypothetical protein
VEQNGTKTNHYSKDIRSVFAFLTSCSTESYRPVEFSACHANSSGFGTPHVGRFTLTTGSQATWSITFLTNLALVIFAIDVTFIYFGSLLTSESAICSYWRWIKLSIASVAVNCGSS